MGTFRQFMRQVLEDAVPAAPTNPNNTTNAHHFDFLKQELGMDDDTFTAAIEGGIQTLYQVPDYGWGFLVQPPVQAEVKDNKDGTFEVKFLLSQKKLNNPKSFTFPFKGRPTYYEGPVEDKTQTLTQEELANLITKPVQNMPQQAPAAPPGPMG